MLECLSFVQPTKHSLGLLVLGFDPRTHIGYTRGRRYIVNEEGFMKKLKSRHSRPRFLADDRGTPSMYLRLCHCCLFLNEGSQHIEKCTKCEIQFIEASILEGLTYSNNKIVLEEDPIQEALADFATEKVESENAEDNLDPDEDFETEKESRTVPIHPISGLSVLW